MTRPLDPLSIIRIDMPQTQQEEKLAQQNGIWNKITTMPTSQKGLLLSLGMFSISTASAAIIEFFEPDPPPNNLFPSFVDTAVVAKNTQKWSLGLISLTTMAATMIYARYFLQRDQQQAENPITPKIASIIKNQVEQEMIKATSGPCDL